MPGARVLPRSGLTVATATGGANLLAYVLSVVLSRRLGPAGFGEVAPLLAVVIVAGVPGQALQAGIARRVATSSSTGSRQLLLRSAVVGAAVTSGLLVLSPVLKALLRLDGWGALLWTAGSLLPVTVSFAAFGVLQGAERFRRLSAALVLLQVGRLLGGTVGVAVGGTAAAAMAGTTLGLLGAAAACVALCDERGGVPAGGRLLAGLARDSASVLAVLVLTNADVLLARARLEPAQAGLYAAGALVAKMAYFAPSFAAPVLYARFSRPETRPGALRTGLALVGGSAVLATAGALLGAPLLPVVLGRDYEPLQGPAWLFAAAGSALAAVFLLVQAGLAVHDHRLAGVAWGVAGVEVLLVVLFADTLHRLVGVVLAGALVLLAVGVVLERAHLRQPADEPPLPPPGSTLV